MFRSLLFLGASLGVMIIGGIVMLPALLFARRLASRTPSWFAGIQLFLLESIAGLALEVRGRKNLPAGAALIAVKHQSALDAYALVRLFPDACFVLKQEILDVPVVGWFIAAMDVIAIDRSAGTASLRQIMTNARRAVDEGKSLVIFPEGRRTAPGERVAYQRGVAGLYSALDVPVVPVALNCGLFWAPKRVRKRPGRAVIALLEAIPPALPRHKFMNELENRIETETSRLIVEAESLQRSGQLR